MRVIIVEPMVRTSNFLRSGGDFFFTDDVQEMPRPGQLFRLVILAQESCWELPVDMPHGVFRFNRANDIRTRENRPGVRSQRQNMGYEYEFVMNYIGEDYEVPDAAGLPVWRLKPR